MEENTLNINSSFENIPELSEINLELKKLEQANNLS